MTDEEREDLNTFKHDLVKQARWWQWKAETLEKENEQLKAENAALRERLEKAVELREPRITVDHWGGLYEVVHDEVKTVVEAYETQQEAEARLAELKERNNERH